MKRLKPDRIVKLLTRAWRIYVMPPKETKIYLDPKNLPVLSHKVASSHTASEPKQVCVDSTRKRAYVTCMRSQVLQEFSYENDELTLTHDWSFPEQCVECEFREGLVYLTTTNFKRGVEQSSHLWLFNPVTGVVVSSVNTQGEWSKGIAIDEERKLIFVSNWHSNDISVIDFSDPVNMKVIQKVKCEEAPRGLALRPDGVILATSFYGRKVFAVGKIAGEYKIIKTSEPFDSAGYSGNMRDILISPDGKIIWVTNLGRNMLIWYNAITLSPGGSISIPREPNSMRFMTASNQIIGVSCRKDGVVCLIDVKTKRPMGISELTEKLPTGLAPIEDGFIVTNFDANSIELHKVRYN